MKNKYFNPTESFGAGVFFAAGTFIHQVSNGASNYSALVSSCAQGFNTSISAGVTLATYRALTTQYREVPHIKKVSGGVCGLETALLALFFHFLAGSRESAEIILTLATLTTFGLPAYVENQDVIHNTIMRFKNQMKKLMNLE